MNIVHWVQTLPWWAPAALTECLFVGFIVFLYPFDMFKWANYVGDAIQWVSWGSFFVFYGVWFGRHSQVFTTTAIILIPIVAVAAFVLVVRRSMKQSPLHKSTSTTASAIASTTALATQLRAGKVLQFPGTRKGRSGQ